MVDFNKKLEKWMKTAKNRLEKWMKIAQNGLEKWIENQPPSGKVTNQCCLLRRIAG